MVLFSGQCAMLFLDPKEPQLELLRSLTSQYILINSAFCIPLSLVNIVRFSIQGMGYSVFAILAAYFLVPALGYAAACFASPAAWISADAFLIPACMLCIARLRRRYPDEDGTPQQVPAPVGQPCVGEIGAGVSKMPHMTK